MQVEKVGNLFKLARCIGALRRNHAVLHLPIGEYQDRQHAAAVERHEIDMPERKLLAPR